MTQQQLLRPIGLQPLAVNPVKQALRDGKVVLGPGVRTAHADIAVTLAGAGFDFLWMDMEHGPLSYDGIRSMIVATRGLKAIPLTRVPGNELWMAKQALDAGSLGVIFPFTNTRELAERAVMACKYPPEGARGFGPQLAASHWGMTLEEYSKFANENVMVIIMIEDRQAVERIEEIAAVPGIDVLFVGANDLSFSLGVGGKTTDPSVDEAAAKVLAVGKRRNIPVGYSTGNPKEIKERIAQGFCLILTSYDLALMQAAARDVLSGIRNQ